VLCINTDKEDPDTKRLSRDDNSMFSSQHYLRVANSEEITQRVARLWTRNFDQTTAVVLCGKLIGDGHKLPNSRAWNTERALSKTGEMEQDEC
jgi:hypothetical protein